MGLLHRILNRTAQPAVQRSYDAATAARTRFNGGANRFSSYGPETVAANPSIRSRARHAAANNALADSAVSAWATTAVGSGIIPTSQHPDPEVRKALDAYFSKWAKQADASGRTDFFGLQTAVVKAQRIDGEAFLMWRGDKLLHLPPEQIADLSTDTIAAGIELNEDGRAVAFHVHPVRPDAMQATYAPPVRVDAGEMLHVLEAAGVGAVRGVSSFAPVLLALAELDGTEDALITQTKIAALLSVILTNDSETSGQDPFEEGQGLEPGAVLRLAGNWRVNTVAPQQSQQAGEFLGHLTRRIAAGLNVPAHLLDGDLRQANYSSLRASLVGFRQRIEQYQYQTLVPQFLEPVWQRVATLAALELGFEINDDLFAVEWIAPAQPWVDPAKDADATISQINAGLMSRRQAVAALGYSIEQLDAEIAADRTREAELGLSFGVKKPEQTGIQS